MKDRQPSLFDFHNLAKRRYGRTTHGGISSRGRRKLKRPLDRKKWHHVVLKSDKAKGNLSFLNDRNRGVVKNIILGKARKFGVRIGEAVNMGNHIHLRLKFKSREGFQNFLRAVTTSIARKVTGARRGQRFGRFWQGLAYSRVIQTGLELLQLKGYFEANRRERHHGPQMRDRYLATFNKYIRSLRSG